MLFLYFKENRLLVGTRLRDWSLVWYEPIGDADDDGTAPIGLYSSHSGLQTREPMEGEVAWIPYFEPTTFHAKTKRERERMQKQFIYDTHHYLAEKDPLRLAELEQTLDQPNYTRWQEWFEIMKAEKSDRRRRRQCRTEVIEQSGLDPMDAEINSDLSDNDALARRFQRPGPRTVPPPHPRPGPTLTPRSSPNRKRRSANTQSGRRKKPRESLDSHAETNADSGHVTDPGFDDSELFDERPPEDQEQTFSLPNNFGPGNGGNNSNNNGGGGSRHPFMTDVDDEDKT